MNFKGQVVVITGAGNGIGKELAKVYAEQGAMVVLSDIDEAAGNRVADEIRAKKGQSIFVQTDVRKEEDVVRLMGAANDTYGKIDILINNAGISKRKSPYELTIEEWDDVLSTNLLSVFLCSRETAKYMKRNGNGGAIVNLASTRALMSEPNSEAYAASKGGIVALTHALPCHLVMTE